MAEALVRGICINYEVIGSRGPWVALSPGSRWGFSEIVDLSKKIAGFGYRVLLHDRRNCGASDVAFDNSKPEHEIWADDLHSLGKELGTLPMYVGGASAGARLAILYGMRYADSLRGLLLWRVTGGQEAVNRLSENYYGQFIRIARAGGMQAVCESDHFLECIKARPSNRERLLEMDVENFVKVMTYWRERLLQSVSLPIIGATESDLRSIKAPACVIAGNDAVHTPGAARQAASFIPNSELHDYVVEERSDGNLLNELDRKQWCDAEPRIAAIFSEFMIRTRK
jgi:pimeloyl-ACP methyl ester carboxylesterase